MHKSLGRNGRGLYQEIQLNSGKAWIFVFLMWDVQCGSYKAKHVYNVYNTAIAAPSGGSG